MNIYIPQLQYTFYGPIVFGSIIIGIIIAAFLMKKANAKKETVIFTVLLTFVSILICSAMTSILITGDIKRIGFVGAGGAMGLLLGIILSAFIHNDHVAESISAWIVVLPLMYGLSKIACHIAGCCHGIPYHGMFAVTYEGYNNSSFFPIQLTETFVFLVIFIVALILYLRTNNKLRIATATLLASGFAKFLLDYLRESHGNSAITGYQTFVLIITILGAISIQLFNNKKATAKK